jgi:hypothetical protein
MQYSSETKQWDGRQRPQTRVLCSLAKKIAIIPSACQLGK